MFFPNFKFSLSTELRRQKIEKEKLKTKTTDLEKRIKTLEEIVKSINGGIE